MAQVAEAADGAVAGTGVARSVVLDLLEELLKPLPRFVAEECVAGSDGLAFRSEGTAGECAIEPASFDLFVGTHGDRPHKVTPGRGVERRGAKLPPLASDFYR